MNQYKKIKIMLKEFIKLVKEKPQELILDSVALFAIFAFFYFLIIIRINFRFKLKIDEWLKQLK